MIKTTKFARKPILVDVVEVTEENLEEVAKWCKGDLRTNKDSQRYVKVRVHRPLNDRQTQAFPGDFVLNGTTGYKVYTAKAFKECFEPAEMRQPKITVSSSQ